jgi:RimJ/RimL family protein N-acetyltransferase/2'-5' RNA ligase
MSGNEPGRLELDDDPGRVDLDALWSFLSTEAYWSRWRTREQLAHQLATAWRVIGAYDTVTGRMVGFARAVSDGVAFGYLADVYVLAEFRGQGLGTALVRAMVEEGAGARFRWMLHTEDAHGLYRRFGFAAPGARCLERPGARAAADPSAEHTTTRDGTGEVIAWARSQPIDGTLARLELLGQRHAADLLEAAGDDEIWAYLPAARPRDLAAVRALIAQAQAERARGQRVAFAIIERASGRAVGSTSLIDLQPVHNHLEIGWTWLARSQWRTGINTEAKLLMLGHAFDVIGVERVTIKTDGRNERSQAAIERLGAHREGTLRRHWRCPDGQLRDTVSYSILKPEWPAVRAALSGRLARGANPAGANPAGSDAGAGGPQPMADHWVWRRGWRPGRRKYAFHITFDRQPAAHRLVTGCQEALRGLGGLDLVPLEWLHLTVQSIGFTDEVSAEDADAILAAARVRLAGLPAAQVTLGPVLVTPEAILLPVTPEPALTPVRAAIRAAILDVWQPSRLAGADAWQPHVTVAYSNASGPAAPYTAALADSQRTAPAKITAVQLIILGRDEHAYQWSAHGTAPLGG